MWLYFLISTDSDDKSSVSGHVMFFTENNLMDDESLVRATRLHPIVLLVPAMMVSVLAGSLSIVNDIPVVFYALAFLVLGATYRFLDRLILFMTSEFAVTSKRVLGKTGFIRLKTLDIVLAKVEAIRIDQTILGRLFNYGDVEVTGTGGTEEVLRFIPTPIEFSKAIQEQLSALEEAKSDDNQSHVRHSGR
jgi:uncharacterized membrane protein YdbT with pleckstrin-like domain